MEINKQIIDQRVRRIVADHPDWFLEERDEIRKLSKSFVLLSVSSYLGIELSEALSLITEGSNDAGIDAIYIGDPIDFDFPVYIFQGKYKFKPDSDFNFPANDVNRVVQTVSAMFDPHKSVKSNDKLKPKLEEILSLISDGYIPVVKSILMNNGSKWNDEGDKHIENAGFPEDQVSFEHFNHDSMVELLKRKDKINDTISMIGKGIVEEFSFKRVLIGKVNVSQIAMLFDRHGDALLEKNIRRYLGLRKNRVNESIKDTLVSEKRNNFYFFNNGITVVCSKFSHNALSSEDWQVRIQDMQIINGGQTCKTIQETFHENASIDFSDTSVLLRLYELPEEEHDQILTDITIATNSQNPVDLRDLRANDHLQRILEAAVKGLGYIYKRKRDTVSLGDGIPSTVAAEAVFAVWREKPHLAKFRRNELFGKFYEDVFGNLNAAQLILAVLIYRYCDNQRKKEVLLAEYPHVSYSNYFLAMLMGREILSELGITVDKLTHLNFEKAKAIFENKKEKLFEDANLNLIDALNKLYHEGYRNVELRRLSATFRRGDLLAVLEE